MSIINCLILSVLLIGTLLGLLVIQALQFFFANLHFMGGAYQEAFAGNSFSQFLRMQFAAGVWSFLPSAA